MIHGDGRHSRDWLYVDDLCQAVDHAIHADLSLCCGRAINLGTGIDTSILAIAEMILDVLGKPRSLMAFSPDQTRAGPASRLVYRQGRPFTWVES